MSILQQLVVTVRCLGKCHLILSSFLVTVEHGSNHLHAIIRYHLGVRLNFNFGWIAQMEFESIDLDLIICTQ